MSAARAPAPGEPLEELRRALGSSSRLGEPLSRHTAIRIGGPADLFFVARSPDDLRRAVREAHRFGVPWQVIGSGSNLLVADAGMAGLVIKATAPGAQIRVFGDAGGATIEADAGAILAAVGKQAALRGLGGMEWAVNVPGTVGASVVNNSGAFGSCVAEHLVQAAVFDPESGDRAVPLAALDYGYRTSRLKRGELVGVVLNARYRVRQAEAKELRARIAEIQATRRATQPSGYSLGSMFANPPGDAAGRLIEQAGLKGFRIGDAEISRLHANFIVNQGKATARDVIALMRHIQEVIAAATGVQLTPEVQLAGRHDPETAAAFRPAAEPVP
jgi:UDP-N-acetylmuramate dehydrogenase